MVGGGGLGEQEEGLGEVVELERAGVEAAVFQRARLDEDQVGLGGRDAEPLRHAPETLPNKTTGAMQMLVINN